MNTNQVNLFHSLGEILKGANMAKKPGIVYLDINNELKKSRPDLHAAFSDFVAYWASQLHDERKADLGGKIVLGGDEYWFNAYFQVGRYGPTIRCSVGGKVEPRQLGYSTPAPAGYTPPQQGYAPPQYRSSPGPNTEQGDPGPQGDDYDIPFRAG